MPTAEVSVVIPAYNEEDVLEHSVTTTKDKLADLPYECELIISDNASTDNTPEIAKDLADTYDRVRYTYEPTAGRGAAVEHGFAVSQGDTLAFLDADLATDMQHLETLMQSVQTGQYDVAIGSRWIPGHEAERPIDRTIASKIFNLLARTLLNSDIRDHQCGFKAFDRDVIETIISKTKATHWFWDTELLVLADYYDYSIKEFPVEWTPEADSAVDLHRDAPKMFVQLLGLMLRLQIGYQFSRESPHMDTK